MKMNIKIAAIALAVFGLAVACKGKSEPVEDTTLTDTVLIEEVVDTLVDTVAVEAAAEATCDTPAPAKKTVKKAEKKEGLSAASSKDNTTIGDNANTTGKMGKVVANNANVQQGTNTNLEKNETTTLNKMGKVAAGKK